MIWALMLTACTTTMCAEQAIQWFEVEKECIEFKTLHEELPQDGHWQRVQYDCRIINGEEA
jgi:hypothetical protein